MAADPTTFLRPATLQDLDAVCALWVNLMQEHEDLDPRFVMAQDAPKRWRNDYPAWIDDGTRRILLAEQQGLIVGFIQAHRHAEPPIFEEVPEVYIDEIYTIPGVRGQGVGRKLLDAILQWAGRLGARQLRLGVLTANKKGIKFWEAAGAHPFIGTYILPVESAGPGEAKKHTRRLGF